MGRLISKSSFSFIVKVVFTISIFYILFSFIPYDEVYEAIIGLDIRWAALGLVAGFLRQGFAAAQMSKLLYWQSIHLPAYSIWLINLTTKFYKLFLPSYLSAGFIRWHRFSKRDKKRTEAAVALIFNRAVELNTLCVIGLVAWLLCGDEKYKVLSSYVFIPLVLSVIVSFLLLLNPVTSRLAEAFFNMLPLPTSFDMRIKKILLGFRRFQSLSVLSHLEIMAISSCRHSLSIVSAYFFSLSLNADLPMLVFGWLRVITNFLGMLPISFGGFGVKEATFVYILGPLGMAAPMALALSLTMYARGACYAILGGFVELYFVFSKREFGLKPKMDETLNESQPLVTT